MGLEEESVVGIVKESELSAAIWGDIEFCVVFCSFPTCKVGIS